jgi:hypothetical protein
LVGVAGTVGPHEVKQFKGNWPPAPHRLRMGLSKWELLFLLLFPNSEFGFSGQVLLLFLVGTVGLGFFL